MCILRALWLIYWENWQLHFVASIRMNHAAQKCWQRPVPWDWARVLRHPLEVNGTHIACPSSVQYIISSFQLCSSASRWPQRTLPCVTIGVDSSAAWWVRWQCVCCPCGSRARTQCMRSIPPIYPPSSRSIRVNWSFLHSPGKSCGLIRISHPLKHFLVVHSVVCWAPALSGYIVAMCSSYVPARLSISFCRRSKCISARVERLFQHSLLPSLLQSSSLSGDTLANHRNAHLSAGHWQILWRRSGNWETADAALQ